MQGIAAGARIVCRDAEWLVKRVTLVESTHRVIEAVGVSEFVQGKEIRFVDAIETRKLGRKVNRNQLRVLLPEETKIVVDNSSGYAHSRLFLEAQLRQTILDQNCLYLGHRGAMDVLPYQLLPAVQALGNPRQRILIADSVGLGKTLECGILLVSLFIRAGRKGYEKV